MTEVRLDNVQAELEVRSEDFQETKTVDLPASAFRIDDATGKPVYADDAARDALLAHVSEAILAVVAHHQAKASDEAQA
jgi:hypothetical protein